MTWRTLLGPMGRDLLFDVAAHVVWADGRLTPNEVASVQGLSAALGLPERDLGRALLARRGRPFESLELASAGPLERPLVYGAASWTSMADGHVSPSELQVLRRIMRALALPDALATRIDACAWSRRGRTRSVAAHTLELDELLGKVTAAVLGADSLAPLPLAPTSSSARIRLRRD